MPYIERLAELWGELCASKEMASEWADRLVGLTRRALSPDRSLRSYFHGTSACLSALFTAERYAEIADILAVDTIWPYKRWAVRALAARGRKAEAIRYAEGCRGARMDDVSVDRICEEILLSTGQVEEAYERYGLRASHENTCLATFRTVTRKYPHKTPSQILDDLIGTTPGAEGKWFAAAREAGLYDRALALAGRSPCDPRTLTRAARDLADENPAFALEAGLLALHWMAQGYGFEITGADVWAAYSGTMRAAQKAGNVAETRDRVRAVVAGEGPGGFVSRILGRELGVSGSANAPAREPERKRAAGRPDGAG
jgi:hypothetical protein